MSEDRRENCEKECFKEPCRDRCYDDCCCNNNSGSDWGIWQILIVLGVLYLLFCNNNNSGKGGFLGGLF